VTIFLDESFPLPRIIELRVPPFRWVSYGWGEFNLKIRLLFCNPSKNKPMDVVHPLKLDPGKSGREVTGYEGYFDVELDKSSEFLAGEQGIDVDEVPRMADVEHLEGGSQGDKSPAPEASSEDTIRVADLLHLDADIEKQPGLVSNGSFSNESVVERVSDLDDLEVRQMVESLEPYAVQLHEIVKKYPLVSDGVKLPYTVAPSDGVFLSWNVGRRKSIEWQRARLLQNDVISELKAEDSTAPTNLTVKAVVVWCRQNQYGLPRTDMDEDLLNPHIPPRSDGDEDSLQYCRYCGMIKDSPPKKGQKRSRPSWGVDAYCRCGQDVSEHLTTMKTSSSVQDMIDRNRHTTQNNTSNQNTSSLTSTEIRALLYQTDANVMRWVWNMIDQLNLPAIDPSVDDEITHPVEDTLAFSAVVTHATKSFLSRLISLASQQSSIPTTEDEDEAATGPSSNTEQNITAPLVVTPIHILRAIQAGSEFDFLTNAGMATGSSQQGGGG
jgi:hypothetical protein